MSIRHSIVLSFFLLVTTGAMAQSRWVLDRNSRPIGQLVTQETRPAIIRFAISGAGDTVLLEATPYGLRSLNVPRVLFTGAGCTPGNAPVFMEILTTQLTQKQAVVVSTYGASPTMLLTSELYVTSAFPAVTLLAAGTTMSSYFNGQCTPGYTIPPNEYAFAVTNVPPSLHTRFQTPFWTP